MLTEVLLHNLPAQEEKSTHCEDYFLLLTKLIKLSKHRFTLDESEANGVFNANELLQKCITLVDTRETLEEHNNTYEDVVLAGHLGLI